MKINKKRMLVLLIVLAVFCVSMHRVVEKYEMKRFTATFFDVFDTRTEIVGYAREKETFLEQTNFIKERLVFYNNLYDIYNDYDGIANLKTINDQAGKQAVKVDTAIIDLLKYSREMYQETNGLMNVAMGSVLRIWHNYRNAGVADPQNARLPLMEDLKAAAEHTDISRMRIDEEALTVYLEDAQMSLDVGGIGKGFAVQRVVEDARARGMNHMLISVGGNVCALGTREDGMPWKVGIQNPNLESTEDFVHKVWLQDGECVVSSGDYQRYYMVGGVRYCHIIHPDTLMPANTFSAVSVITKDSGEADAFSTAIYNMTLEEGMEFVNEQKDVEALWIMKDGSMKYSQQFQKCIADDNEDGK